mmetsp:Transcript_48957/g.151159  ORF Transcript_48957/g.151159 Transcript_48957/m.151159 type:complete len:449 (-) Transcript_48957:74-1420(-)
MAVLLETSLGDLVIDLKVDEAPRTCTNFLKLCKIKYYNNCLFHTVQKGYIAQAGDPTNTGKGGSSIHAKLPGLSHRFFNDEISLTLKHNAKGTIAMANEKPNENGSQFYITLRDSVPHLDGKHTIFGVLAEGLDVLEKIDSVMVDEKDAPYQNIRIWHTEILDDPFPDPDGLEPLIPPKSPEVVRDEAFKKIEGEEDEEELQERMAATLAKSQATTLELLHDLPDAEITPPDNDLFIAKLNPVTQDGDLELIFSRFGPIKSCEIVRDWKTGDSLQYAFITFENVKDCEQAYFKMHDCVIDDRRIFVNFSQSVAKLWNKWRTGSKITNEDAREAKGRGRGKGGRGRGRSAEEQALAGHREQSGNVKHRRAFAASDAPRPGTEALLEERGRAAAQRGRGRDRSRSRGRERSDRARDHEHGLARDDRRRAADRRSRSSGGHGQGRRRRSRS